MEKKPKYKVGDLVLVKAVTAKTYLNRKYDKPDLIEDWALACVGMVGEVCEVFSYQGNTVYEVECEKGHNLADVLEDEIEPMFVT